MANVSPGRHLERQPLLDWWGEWDKKRGTRLVGYPGCAWCRIKIYACANAWATTGLGMTDVYGMRLLHIACSAVLITPGRKYFVPWNRNMNTRFHSEAKIHVHAPVVIMLPLTNHIVHESLDHSWVRMVTVFLPFPGIFITFSRQRFIPHSIINTSHRVYNTCMAYMHTCISVSLVIHITPRDEGTCTCSQL